MKEKLVPKEEALVYPIILCRLATTQEAVLYVAVDSGSDGDRPSSITSEKEEQPCFSPASSSQC